jgi:hypothetical protein
MVMQIHRLRVDPAALVAALSGPELLAAWMLQASEEPAGLADAALLRHLAKLRQVAARVQVAGLDHVAVEDHAGVDQLLTDILALALWHGWALPVVDLGTHDGPRPSGPTGILGSNQLGSGAGVWLEHLSDGQAIVSFSPCREAGEDADMEPHWKSQH